MERFNLTWPLKGPVKVEKVPVTTDSRRQPASANNRIPPFSPSVYAFERWCDELGARYLLRYRRVVKIQRWWRKCLSRRKCKMQRVKEEEEIEHFFVRANRLWKWPWSNGYYVLPDYLEVGFEEKRLKAVVKIQQWWRKRWPACKSNKAQTVFRYRARFTADGVFIPWIQEDISPLGLWIFHNCWMPELDKGNTILLRAFSPGKEHDYYGIHLELLHKDHPSTYHTLKIEPAVHRYIQCSKYGMLVD